MKDAPHLLTSILPRRRLPRRLHADRAWATARALPEGVHGRAFRDLVQEIDGSPWHPLGELRLFHDGAETFAAIEAAIRAARQEVLLEMYIVRDDDVGRALQAALVSAAGRGVRVCVLADAVGSMRTPRAFWHTLAQAGIAVRRFGPYLRSPLHAWRRDHRKIIVLDRATAFTGGMNIGEEYGSALAPGPLEPTEAPTVEPTEAPTVEPTEAPRGPERRATDAPGGAERDPSVGFRDVFVQVKGPVVPELAAVFAEGWMRAGGRPLHDWRPPRRMKRGELPAAPTGRSVLVLDGGPGRGQRETVAVLAALVGAVRSRLWITTPYFVPPNAGLRMLEDAAARGVDVRLLLPSRYDVPVVRHAAHAVYRRLLRAGVRVFEYERAILHAKTVVGDEALCMVGSANLDFRSLFINAECNLMIADAGTTRQLAARFLTDLEGAREITPEVWSHRPYPARLLETTARSVRLLL